MRRVAKRELGVGPGRFDELPERVVPVMLYGSI
jgi:hypothetical protein